jgi:hypothetical protein
MKALGKVGQFKNVEEYRYVIETHDLIKLVSVCIGATYTDIPSALERLGMRGYDLELKIKEQTK